MKNTLILFAFVFVLLSCSKTETVDDSNADFIALKIAGDKSEMQVNDTILMTVTYTDEFNKNSEVAVNYNFDNTLLKSLENNRFVALKRGTAAIQASYNDVESNSFGFLIGDKTVEIDPNAGSRMIEGSWFYKDPNYAVMGKPVLSYNDDGDLILTVGEDFNSLAVNPGPTLYLSNDLEKIDGGIKVIAVTSSLLNSLPQEFNITELYPSGGYDINSFGNLVVWCEPFNVFFAGATFGDEIE